MGRCPVYLETRHDNNNNNNNNNYGLFVYLLMAYSPANRTGLGHLRALTSSNLTKLHTKTQSTLNYINQNTQEVKMNAI